MADIRTEEIQRFAKILSTLPLFAALSSEDVFKIASSAHECKLVKGELLFQRGDLPRGFYYVLSGQIKLAISSPQGNEKIIEIIQVGQSFGEALMFLNRPYPVFSEALADSLLIHVGQNSILSQIARDPEFSKSMLAGMAMRLHSLIHDVEAYTLKSSLQRVIGYLLQSGDSPNTMPTVVALPMSKQVLASRLNLTPETLSRIFHELSEAGLISVSGRHVNLLDPHGLARYGE